MPRQTLRLKGLEANGTGRNFRSNQPLFSPQDFLLKNNSGLPFLDNLRRNRNLIIILRRQHIITINVCNSKNKIFVRFKLLQVNPHLPQKLGSTPLKKAKVIGIVDYAFSISIFINHTVVKRMFHFVILLKRFSNPGNEVSMQAVSSIVVSPSAINPAIAKDMAIRWSP